MTPDERIEALLNRAGQTISDLPMPSAWCFAHDVNNPKINDQVENLIREFVRLDDDEATGIRAYTDFILHLTDIIDRMETALENVCGERDYLRHVAGVDGCWTCTNSESGAECHRPEGCVLNDEGRCVGYDYAGIPEDWSVDDSD